MAEKIEENFSEESPEAKDEFFAYKNNAIIYDSLENMGFVVESKIVEKDVIIIEGKNMSNKKINFKLVINKE
jgi:hypothetical protein